MALDIKSQYAVVCCETESGTEGIHSLCDSVLVQDSHKCGMVCLEQPGSAHCPHVADN